MFWFQLPWVTLKGGTWWVVFLADLHNYARMVWPSMTKFCLVTHLERSASRGQPCLLITRGWGPRVCILFGTPYLLVWPRSSKFDVITCGGEACFRGSACPRLQGAGCQHHPHFETLLHACTHDQTKCEVNFYRVDCKCWCVICLW